VTYLVKDECIKCKHMDCVEVCPVDCFYEGENFLSINPDECIDCGVCEPECPVNAIVPDNALEGDELAYWLKINTETSLIWPNITLARPEDVPKDAADWKDVPNKRELLSMNPGKGDE
jgi:ferredoxin